MLRVVGRRLVYTVLTVLLATILVFVALQALPGSLATQVLGQDATPEAVAQLEAKLHLDQPAWQRYAEWLGGAVRGDFGDSLVSGQPVWSEARLYLRNTAVLTFIVVIIGVPLSLLLGVAAGLARDRWPDLTISTLSLIAMSVPGFTVATLLALVFAVKLAWFPAVVTAGPTATLGELMAVIWLPAAALTIGMAAYIVRMMRTSVIDVMASDYVTMADVRGLSHSRVLVHHMLPNALLPTLNVIAINIAWLAGGVVVVETVFSYPGIGSLMLEAVRTRDLPVLMFIAVLGSVTYVICNLLADLAAIWFNPRLRTSGRAG
ncbi:MAG: ABC transporter permease [Thermoleophilia bacterium]